MSFIKNIFVIFLKQLDKLILGAVLIIFILILLWLMETINKSTQEINSSSSVGIKRTKYTPLDITNTSTQSYFAKSKLWIESPKRNNDNKSNNYIISHTDFVLPFKIARSIANGADNKLIPYKNYLAGICPISKEPLPKPDSDQLSNYTSNYDYDDDGIPDVMEKKYGLNPESYQDGQYDSDNDSFSNIVEYRYNKEGVLNPKIHPPLITRIRLVKVASTKIPIIVKHILKVGYNKNNWKIQINILTPHQGWRTKFLKIGDKFEVNSIKYVIKDIKEEYETSLNPRLGILESVDKSVIVLEDSLDQAIDAVMEQPVYEPSRRVLIKDLFTNKEIITKINNTVTLGDAKTGIEKYKLISIGDNNRQLTFEDEKAKETFIVKRVSKYKKPPNS
jgi:hypothetical protein